MSDAGRRLMPLSEGTGKSDADGSGKRPDRPLPPRRSPVKVACGTCRLRKVRCDARRPQCTPCMARGRDCEYATEDASLSHHGGLKRKYSHLEREHADFVELFGMLKRRPEDEARVILNRIRNSSNLSATLSFIRDGDLLKQAHLASLSAHSAVLPDTTSALESFLNIHHANTYSALLGSDLLTGAATSELRAAAFDPVDLESAPEPSATIRNRPHDERLSRVRASRWTTVTGDNEIFADIISIYLSYDHATFRLFDEDYFLDQLVSMETDYCSPLLVNAVLAYGSCNYKAFFPEKGDALTWGFYEEARHRLHDEQSHANLLQVPAAMLLNMWCNAHDKGHLAFLYLSQGIQIAKSLGLLGPSPSKQSEKLDGRSDKGRTTITWGCFNWQTMQAFLLQTESAFSAPPMLLPTLTPETDQKSALWDPFPLDLATEAWHPDKVFLAYSKLMLLLQQHISTRHALASVWNTKTAFENTKLLYLKLLDWAKSLHFSLVPSYTSLPLVYNIHLIFHQIVIELFRPYARTFLGQSDFTNAILTSSFRQLQRILYCQQRRFAGPPLCGSNAGPMHCLMMALFDQPALSQPDEVTNFFVVLCTVQIRKIALSYPAIGLILHSILAHGKRQAISLPKHAEAVYQEMDANLPTSLPPDEIPGQYPIDLALSLTNPAEANPEAAIRAT